MKTKIIPSQPMRKITLLLLFVTGFALAQPAINTPPPLQMCDYNNDTFETWDLTVTLEYIRNGNPNLSVFYYETLTDSQTMSNPIANPTNFVNIIVPPQTIYVTVIDPLDPTPAFTSFDLVLVPTPTANQAPDLTVVDIPYDGQATFDLTTQDTAITTDPGTTVTYYPSLPDAQAGTNPFANPTAYINTTNPQTIFAKVDNISGCSSIVSFQLIVTNPDIVYIPDPNFKWELVYGSIATDAFSAPVLLDTNGDGEIQVTEALLAYRLDPANIATTTYEGIKSFLNLQVFYTPAGCNIDTLDVSGLQNLKNLGCAYIQLHTLNITNCPALETLFCGGNLWISTLDLTGKPNLIIVWCEQNQISSLDVTGAPLLQALSCRNNSLSTLDLSNNTALTDLNCGVNPMSVLDVSPCTNLINFHCAGAPITTLNMAGLTNIVNLNVRYTNLTSLDVSNFPYLGDLNCDGNLFTELNLSHNPVLCSVQCSASNTLNYLNIKNGGTCNSAYVLYGNSNLQFVCVDEDEADYYQSFFDGQGMPTVVNSYCSFAPGGNFNTITGSIIFDGNSDGCDAGDTPQPNIKINIDDTTSTGATFTDTTGNYSFHTQDGNFTITPEIENPAWFTFSPATATIPFADNDNNTVIQNFCLAPNGIHRDVEMVIQPLTPARPGFEATYKLVYKNKGNQALSGTVNLQFDDAKIDFVSAFPAVNSQTFNSLDWNYINLKPFESRSILVTLNINSPVEIPAVNNGDILNFIATINPIIGDDLPSDNVFAYSQTVVGSFDPNDITCLEGEMVAPSEIGNYLHYVARFENTGTYQAENVIVKVIVDTNKYDINTLQLLNTSHPSYTKISGNVVEFIFENINLAAATGAPPVGGHGDVLFKIKTKENLVTNDTVLQRAGIYFDYNFPVITNDAETTFAVLSNAGFEQDNSISIYPNPTNAIININCNSIIESIELYDIQGRILETFLENSTNVTFDISSKQNGIYFLKITSDKGSKVEKIVKE